MLHFIQKHLNVTYNKEQQHKLYCGFPKGNLPLLATQVTEQILSVPTKYLLLKRPEAEKEKGLAKSIFQ